MNGTIKNTPTGVTSLDKRPLWIATAVALLGTLLLFVYLRRFEREATGGAPTTVLVALKPLEPGATLGEPALGTRQIPLAYVENRAVRLSEKARVLGLHLSTRVQTGQTLMWTDLAIASDDRRDLSSLVEPGMRAVTVHTTRGSDRANELIRPGDRVDVILTSGGMTDRDPKTSVVLLQDVLVLAVGLDTGSDVGEKRAELGRDSLLTLSLTIRDAQLESLAAERGTLSVALRNPDDVRIVDGLAELSSAGLLDARFSRSEAVVAQAPPVSAGPTKLESAALQRTRR